MKKVSFFVTHCQWLLKLLATFVSNFHMITFLVAQLISLTKVSLTHSLTDNVTNKSIGHTSVVCGSILTFFTILPPRNLTRKPFMMIRRVKKLSCCGPVDLVFSLNFFRLIFLLNKCFNLHGFNNKFILMFPTFTCSKINFKTNDKVWDEMLQQNI